MKTTYIAIHCSDAYERKLPGYEDEAPSWGSWWGLWRCVDGVPVEEIGTDGGEPEDKILVRDFRWVAEHLNAAASSLAAAEAAGEEANERRRCAEDVARQATAKATALRERYTDHLDAAVRAREAAESALAAAEERERALREAAEALLASEFCRTALGDPMVSAVAFAALRSALARGTGGGT